mmetsp:Transcript_86822/g.194439  ORF Transcript_86822/g.194439 Transcript_86822/m.194439 type:complete len:405 (+) Transcript_86822:98-1312(+)
MEVAPIAGAHMEKLQKLLGVYGPPPGLAEELSRSASGTGLRSILVACLAQEGGSAAFTEMQALTLIVRLLGSEAGDLNGDDLPWPVPVHPGGLGAQAEAEGAACSDGVASALRSEALVMALLDLWQRRAPQFERSEEPHLLLETLRALRLALLCPPGAPAPWWVEEELGHRTNGEVRRRLVDVTLRALLCTGSGLSERPKIAALGCLWSLAANSHHCRSHILQVDGAAPVLQALRAQVRASPPIVEAALIAECRVLTAMAVGPRSHARRLAALGVDGEALEVLRRFGQHRKVVAAAFALLAVVAFDEAAAARLAVAPGGLAVAAAARDRWPEEVEEATAMVESPLAPALRALLPRGAAAIVAAEPNSHKPRPRAVAAAVSMRRPRSLPRSGQAHARLPWRTVEA